MGRLRSLTFIFVLVFSTNLSARLVEVGILYGDSKTTETTPVASTSSAKQKNDVTAKRWSIKKTTKKLTIAAEKKWKDMKNRWTSYWNDGATKADTKVSGENTQPSVSDQAAAPPILTPQQEALEKLPSVKNPEKVAVGEMAQRLSQEVKEQPLFRVSKPGRRGQALPQFNVKEISRIDLGEEPLLEPNSFDLSQYKVMVQDPSQAQPLKGPKELSAQILDKWKKTKVAKANKKELKGKNWKMSKPVTRERIAKLLPRLEPVAEQLSEKPFQPMSTNDKKLLVVEILHRDKDNCPALLGLGRELIRKTQFKDYGRFVVGSCAARLGLHSEAVAYLAPLLKKKTTGEYTQQALDAIIMDLPEEYYSKVGPLLRGLYDTQFVNDQNKSAVSYIIAKEGYSRNLNTRAINFTAQVADTSPLYAEAQYLQGAAQYNKGRVKEAQSTFQKLRKRLQEEGSKDKNLLSLISLSMGRIHFAQKNYKRAFNEYQSINKSHPSWIQAMTEMGWVQLALGDAPGAIGNMYSIQSPYFKSVYKPETYVIRAIGYLNICQYGDAYKTISLLEHQHKGWLQKVAQYRKQKPSGNALYSTTFKYLKGKSEMDVDGLPHQVIREIARRRNFLKVQEQINRKYDENALYSRQMKSINKELASVNWKKKKAKERLAKLRLNLKKSKTDKSLAKMVNEWEAKKRNETLLVMGYGYQGQIYKNAKKQLRYLKNSGKKRFDREMASLKKNAGRSLVANLKDIRQNLLQLFENNEFLRYEVFAGSGEDIRYQASGGTGQNVKRVPAHIKPKKIMSWDFDGEYWEDEIGSYRSSLKNNCPNFQQASLGGNQ